MKYYKVTFICYRYNCGGMYTNGYYKEKEVFATLADALAFADKVESLARQKSNGKRLTEIPEGSSEFAYSSDGTMEVRQADVVNASAYLP